MTMRKSSAPRLLTEAMVRKGHRQTDVADALGVSQSAISLILSGKTLPSEKLARGMFALYGLAPSVWPTPWAESYTPERLELEALICAEERLLSLRRVSAKLTMEISEVESEVLTRRRALALGGPVEPASLPASEQKGAA